MSIEEWAVGTGVRNKSRTELQFEVDAHESIGLFAEAFYFFAWRLIEVLNGHGEYKFPNLERMRAKGGVGFVRNDLIRHPEKKEKNFIQGLVRKFEKATAVILARETDVQQRSTATDHPDPDHERPREGV